MNLHDVITKMNQLHKESKRDTNGTQDIIQR